MLQVNKNKHFERATTTMIFVFSCIFVQQGYLHLFGWFQA